MSVSPSPTGSPPLPHADTRDVVAALEASTWAMAAVVGTMRDALSAPLAEVLVASPQRSAVLEAAGLLSWDGAVPVPHPSLVPADGPLGRSTVEARLSSLRQAVAAAAQDVSAPAGGGWAELDDEVLLNQGRASAATGRALATRVVPGLPGLAERLAAPDGRVLDVGTGVAALAVALARELPGVSVVGIDVLPRALDLARGELVEARDVADRISLRCQDVAELAEPGVYDLVWLPAPFLPEETLVAALPRLAEALRPGGWIVTGTNPPAGDPLRAAVDRWNAVRNGGNTYDTDRMAQVLAAAGLDDVRRFPTVPGGPVLVAARRPGA
ncbi:cyclopropane-fatty-acyl-phospholipid synthase family protein [Micromonospora sp. CV4]|uniref:SAM-dependent methyltransferase n=1 Tax=Micromonospora sp. CV4 TaxID=2478711 RepID=UPI000EF4829B|nr:class I SAM-dependent methyltransferase [Micromonospora sp. CV4]RLP98418.1 class I SAM-dependent methyltransferase [Micromonospora sp. CV4]